MGRRTPGFVFLILGLSFIALGLGARRTFLFAGIAFLIIGLVSMARGRRS